MVRANQLIAFSYKAGHHLAKQSSPCRAGKTAWIFNGWSIFIAGVWMKVDPDIGMEYPPRVKVSRFKIRAQRVADGSVVGFFLQ